MFVLAAGSLFFSATLQVEEIRGSL